MTIMYDNNSKLNTLKHSSQRIVFFFRKHTAYITRVTKKRVSSKDHTVLSAGNTGGKKVHVRATLTILHTTHTHSQSQCILVQLVE